MSLLEACSHRLLQFVGRTSKDVMEDELAHDLIVKAQQLEEERHRLQQCKGLSVS